MKHTKYLLLVLVLSMLSGAGFGAEVVISVFPDSLKPGEKGVIKAEMTIPAGKHQAYIPGEEDFFYLKAESPHLTFGETMYPQPSEKTAAGEWKYRKRVVLQLPFTVKSTAPTGKTGINVEMGYNPCLDTGVCQPPESVEKKLAVTVIGAAVVETVTQPDTPETEKADSAVALPVQATPPIEEPAPLSNVWKYLLFAFLGGIILNAMPCILPLLSIKAMGIVKQAHEDKSLIMKHSFAYTAGILVSFLILAAIVIALKVAGESIGWGFQFQNTAFVLAMTSIIFVFALSLFDVFAISPPGMGAATKASAQGGVGGSFFTGIFAVLLATPCTAPLLGAALGFAFLQPPSLIVIFFLLIGLGLALPFILLGFNHKLLKLIPKPGEWMNIFKEAMGFLLLATVVWLLNVVYKQSGGIYLMKALSFLVFLGFAAWLYGRFVRAEYSRRIQWIFTLLALIVIVGSAWVLLPYDNTPAASAQENALAKPGFEDWLKFSTQEVDELVAKGEPVFVAVGAEWCKNCTTNEKNVLKTDRMKQYFAEKKVILVKGDITKSNPEIQSFIERYGRAGVPFYILFVPGKEYVLFPEIISISMLKKALDEIK